MNALPKEMAAWVEEEHLEPLPLVDGNFWRGLVVGLPVGAALWTLILLAIW